MKHAIVLAALWLPVTAQTQPLTEQFDLICAHSYAAIALDGKIDITPANPKLNRRFSIDLANGFSCTRRADKTCSVIEKISYNERTITFNQFTTVDRMTGNMESYAKIPATNTVLVQRFNCRSAPFSPIDKKLF